MLEKQRNVSDFMVNLQSSLKSMLNIINESYNNLFLVNVNSPYIIDLLYDILKKNGTAYKLLLSSELEAYPSLGGFLRSKIMNNSATNDETDILILNFVNVLGELYTDTIKIADEININRDLFTIAYNSIIILVPPTLCYEIQTYAVDFCSCLSAYIDISKWFCTPLTLPIVRIRMLPNLASQNIRLYKRSRNNYIYDDDIDFYEEIINKTNKNNHLKMVEKNRLYDKFIEIKANIIKVNEYSHNKFINLLSSIENFPDKANRYDLMNLFINVMSNIKIPKNLYNECIYDFKNLLSSLEYELLSVDSRAMISEFFYKCGEFENAIISYRDVINIVEDFWYDDNKDYVISFLMCNIAVCKFINKNEHLPSELINQLNNYLDNIEKDSSEDYYDFKCLYMILVKSVIVHHTYVQHKDIFAQLLEANNCKVSVLDLTEAYKGLLNWEHFILSDFKPQNSMSNSNILEDILVNVQEMIYWFSKGCYEKSKNAYSIAKSLSESYGYIDLLKIIRIFRNNTIKIREKIFN